MSWQVGKAGEGAPWGAVGSLERAGGGCRCRWEGGRVGWGGGILNGGGGSEEIEVDVRVDVNAYVTALSVWGTGAVAALGVGGLGVSGRRGAVPAGRE